MSLPLNRIEAGLKPHEADVWDTVPFRGFGLDPENFPVSKGYLVPPPRNLCRNGKIGAIAVSIFALILHSTHKLEGKSS